MEDETCLMVGLQSLTFVRLEMVAALQHAMRTIQITGTTR